MERRLIRFGERFRPEELERGEVELELPESAEWPGFEPSEPWARRDDDG